MQRGFEKNGKARVSAAQHARGLTGTHQSSQKLPITAGLDTRTHQTLSFQNTTGRASRCGKQAPRTVDDVAQPRTNRIRTARTTTDLNALGANRQIREGPCCRPIEDARGHRVRG
jgi:hypothetical protein